MAARFVTVDHDTPLLLPPDMRDWVPEGHIVHFIMDAVGLLKLGTARVNHRGTGDAQYPPSLMLGLLIYCYATGTFSSRKIEGLTHDSVAVRYLCADTHPDHDSICKFRRENDDLLKTSFHQVLELAVQAKVLKVGDITLAADGTKIMASASKHSAVSHGHALEQMKLLSDEVDALLQKAETADSTPLADGLNVPDEVKRRSDRLAKLEDAVKVMEERAKERLKEELGEHAAKVAQRATQEAATGRKARGRAPQPPKEGPRESDQFNFTDPESRIMSRPKGDSQPKAARRVERSDSKAGSGAHFEQSYNAQAAVEIESRLIVAQGVSDAPNDKQQLVPTLAQLSPVIQSVSTVLVDSGYYSESAVQAVEQSRAQGALQGTQVLAATKRQRHGRSVAQLEQRDDPPAPPAGAAMSEIMAHQLATKAGKAQYAQRKQTIEPVFGIIKSALGFRQFSLRGKAKVRLEWTLVTLSYNLKRLFHMGAKLTSAA